MDPATQNLIAMVKKNPSDASKVAFDSYGKAMMISPLKAEKLTSLGYESLKTKITDRDPNRRRVTEASKQKVTKKDAELE